jgi:Tfp pilus assembly protein PilF/alkyl hydroperoxide reductase subunit AhpC
MIGKKKTFSRSSLSVLLVSLFAAVILLPVHSLALIGIKEGDRAKEIVLSDLDGKTVNMAEFFGSKHVVLVFWELPLDNSFLNYSLDALNHLNDLYSKHHDKSGLEVVGIYTPVDDKDIPEKEISEVRQLIASNRINFPILIDRGLKYYREYGVIALPTTVMVSKPGTIEFVYPSFPQTAPPIISRQVRALIRGTKVEPPAKKVKEKESDSQKEGLYLYALQMFKKGLLEQSFSSLEKTIALNPDNLWAHNLMGIILWKRGMATQSREEFEKAIALDMGNIVPHLNSTILLFDQRKYDEAEELLIKAPTVHDEFNIRAHWMLGLIYKNSNRIDQSLKELELAYSLLEVMTLKDEETESYSFRIPILRDLAELHSRKGDYKKAIELLNEAVQVALGHDRDVEAMPLNQRKSIMLYE